LLGLLGPGINFSWKGNNNIPPRLPYILFIIIIMFFYNKLYDYYNNSSLFASIENEKKGRGKITSNFMLSS